MRRRRKRSRDVDPPKCLLRMRGVTTQMDVDRDGFVENVADKLGILRARVSGDLQRFKKFIEDRPTETGAWRGDVSRPDA
jgi:hypothetical protein